MNMALLEIESTNLLMSLQSRNQTQTHDQLVAILVRHCRDSHVHGVLYVGCCAELVVSVASAICNATAQMFV
jgi:hypothetical protein